MSPRCLLLVTCLLASLTQAAYAHPLSPPSLSIRAREAGHYAVSFRRSTLAADKLTIDWPRDCTATPSGTHAQADQLVDELSLQCQHSLAGQTLRVFGLLELELSMLVQIQLSDPEHTPLVRALLSPAQPSLIIPRRVGPLEVFMDYLGLGVTHLLGGPDHILFVLGLLLLVRTLRARLLALTSFTLGHSITLCLSALSIIHLPQAPVEVGIALSLVVLALELLSRSAQERQTRHGTRRACLLASGFGLLHGLGFASALRETGLPPHAVPLSLFGFNVGVELGQLLVVLALMPCLFLLTQLRATRQTSRTVLAYGIGALAAMWCLERVTGTGSSDSQETMVKMRAMPREACSSHSSACTSASRR